MYPLSPLSAWPVHETLIVAYLRSKLLVTVSIEPNFVVLVFFLWFSEREYPEAITPMNLHTFFSVNFIIFVIGLHYLSLILNPILTMNNKVAKVFLGQRRKKIHFTLINDFHRTVKQVLHLKISN